MPRGALSEPISGANVLITGAGRGMGALYARRAAAEGAASVALWDVDGEAAESVAAEVRRAGVKAEPFVVDVSRPDQIVEGVARVREALGAPDILVNNAGIVRGVPFWEHDPSRDIELTMRINTLAPMWLTREVLPDMFADPSRPKRILNIASAAGTLANPNMSVYASSKWAMIGWSESLRLELARSPHRHISVTTFCPSYVSTGMFAGARGPLLTPIMSPEQAVDAAWNGMKAGQPIVSKPWTVKLGMAARGILPTRAWDWVADHVFQVYSSMDHFTGRSGK
ncbi:SDR family NAD(P)-dependent oxidoreductase [Microbacterium sp. NPDC096154]|uniref:SDR family NAD(P)-dependent oxidoreductase n=1 Tax=Microbacterium sp. NPDC096154 TaxID=3155549 RepID=UPI0033194E33